MDYSGYKDYEQLNHHSHNRLNIDGNLRNCYLYELSHKNKMKAQVKNPELLFCPKK